MIQGTKDEYDKKLLKRLYQVIDKEKNKLDPLLVPTIEVENVNINYIRNILQAREILRNYYDGETYQLQIDSHVRL